MFFCVDRAKVALDSCCQALFDSSVKPPTLCISGIGHFQNSVVFAKVKDDEEFDRLHTVASVYTVNIIFRLVSFSNLFLFWYVVALAVYLRVLLHIDVS